MRRQEVAMETSPGRCDTGEGFLVSQSKETGQSTTYHCLNEYQCKAGAGVDGIIADNNMFHTKDELRPLWWVNLGKVYKVLKVVSTNRIDCCADRLRQMLVHVGEKLETSPMELCGQSIGPAVDVQVIVTLCKTLPEGQIVKLTSVNSKPTAFHLTEVEVYGV
ncbi:unnamed protein product [Mytilus coruscus]|uniref:Fucolectin tachylectin-4 pentraxin-1 domain-containing protein n=1 Tax=Mytilus coruscus TaxID=42192 RepID=A0A6J8A0I2_MYTCO|nr:unnamed protein product [Mytilus coruscus]